MSIQFDGIHFFLFNKDRVLGFYGIIIVVGAVLGAWLAAREAKRRGHDPEIVWDLLIYLMIGGVIGARIWHILTPSPSTGLTTAWYFSHPLDMLAVWRGGLGIPGAVIGGAAVLFFYSRRMGLSFSGWADIIAPSLALGQAVGRWGNYFNQELYGAPTNLPWKIFIEPAERLVEYQNVEYYHPLFLYESIWNFANMFFLLWMSRRFADRLKSGDIFLVYLVTYPVGRFFLDFLRLDASMVGGLNINQVVMAVVALCSAGALYLRHRKV